ncbi:MAG: methyl-accepting chemotaxis protein [Myxococcales bacterium]
MSDSNDGWSSFSLPGVPTGRDGAQHLWIRTRLPEALPADADVFVRYIDVAFEAYVDGKLVYRHGQVDGEPGAPSGRPWHLFRLGDDPAGRMLSLRIWSDKGSIGPFGRFYVGPRQALLASIVRVSLLDVGLGALCFAIALCGVALLAVNRQDRALRFLVGLASACAAYTLSNSSNPLKQLVVGDITVWFTINVISLYLTPAFYFGIYETMTTGRLQNAARWIRRGYLAFALVSVSGAAADVFSLFSSMQLFNLVLLPAGMLFGLVTAIRSAARGSRDVGWFLAGLCCAVIAGLNDLVVDARLVPSERHLAPAGLCAFSALIALYLARIWGRAVTERARMADELALRHGELVDARFGIADAAGQIDRKTRAILEAASEHLQSSSHQSAAYQRTHATVAQIAVSSRQVAGHAEVMIGSSERSEALSQQGRAAVENAIAGLQRLAERVEAMARRVEALSAHRQRIAEIVETVRGLADRTSILAVNASLEAARAGEEGRGFAVVAREMKQLADSSRSAAGTVGDILKQVGVEIESVLSAGARGREDAQQAAKLARRAGEVIAGLVEAIEGSVELARQIAEGTREQSAGLDDIVHALADSAAAIESALGETSRIERETRTLVQLAAELRALAG